MRSTRPLYRATEVSIAALFGTVIARRCAWVAAVFATGGKGAVCGRATIAAWRVVVAWAWRCSTFTASITRANTWLPAALRGVGAIAGFAVAASAAIVAAKFLAGVVGTSAARMTTTATSA